MLALGVVVCPVDDTTLAVVLVDPRKEHYITHSQRLNARSDINIVRHQQRLPRGKPQDETLMLTAFCVIAQNALNSTSAGDKYITSLSLKKPCQLLIRGAQSLNAYGLFL